MTIKFIKRQLTISNFLEDCLKTLIFKLFTENILPFILFRL